MIDQKIIRDAADLYGCTVADLKSPKRHRKYADARAVVCYILCQMRGWTYSEVGRTLHRTHSTVIYFNRRADEWLKLPILNPRGACAIKELVKRYNTTEQ